jgi:putative glycosyltransferase (TIGR04372 family)
VHTQIRKQIFTEINRKIIGPILRCFIKISGLNKKFRFLNTNPAAIGHLCADVDGFLKEKKLFELRFKGVLLAPSKKVANHSIVSLWSRTDEIVTIRNEFLCWAFDYLRVYSDTSFDCSQYCASDYVPASIYQIKSKYLKSKCEKLSLPEDLMIEGRKIFQILCPDLCVNKLVLFHCRDSSYDRSTHNPNFFSQTYRNGDIRSFKKIFEFLNSKGYRILRIGDFEDNPMLRSEYSVVPQQQQRFSDLFQVYAAANCAAFIGSASGAVQLASIFDRPVFLANVLPYALLRPHNWNGMAVPKILRDHRGEILTAEQIFRRGYHWLRSDDEYKNKGIFYENNRSTDITEDFVDFFNAFVLHDGECMKSLLYSDEMMRYRAVCSPDSYDFFADSLIASKFLRKFKIA